MRLKSNPISSGVMVKILILVVVSDEACTPGGRPGWSQGPQKADCGT